MKVLFFIRSLHLGGAERQLVYLTKSLKSNGHDIAVLTMYSGGIFESDLRGVGIEIFSLEKKSRWDLVRPIFRMSQLVRQLKPDVLHSYMTDVNVLSVVCGFLGSKSILVWGVRNAGLDRKMYGLVERILFWLEIRFSSIPSLINANSEAGRMLSIREGFGPKNFEVVKNGIDTSRFFRDGDFRSRGRDQWGLSGAVKVLGVIGRIDPQKDHQNFIAAIALLPESEKKRIKVLCVGHDTEEEIVDLRLLCAQLGVTEIFLWAPRNKNVVEVLNVIDVLVSSSVAEGFSNVVVEALAVGIPCVVTDVGDSREIVSTFGVVVPPKNPQALSHAITEVLNNAAFFSDEFRRAARSHVADQFSIAQLSQRTEELLQQLIIDRRRTTKRSVKA